MKQILSLLTIGFALSACAPSQQQINSADIGAYPVNYKTHINAAVDQLGFFDPDSVKIRNISTPVKGYYKNIDNPLEAYTNKYGWIVCFETNGKNRLGGYTGYKKNFLAINNGKTTIVSEHSNAACK